MTIDDAIKTNLRCAKEFENIRCKLEAIQSRQYVEWLEKLKAYEEIGTVEELKELRSMVKSTAFKDGYIQGRAYAEEEAENRFNRVLDDEKRISYEQGRADAIEKIIRTEKSKFFCIGDLCTGEKDCSDCRVEYWLKLKEKQND